MKSSAAKRKDSILSRTILLCSVFVLSAIFYLCDIGQQSIKYSDEATHVRVIQEMIATGSYLNPTLDGRPYLNKPPFKMWMTIALTKIAGESNFTYRLIDGLCSAGIVTLVLLLGLSIFKKRLPALISAFTLLGSQGFFVTARQNTATQDAFVVFCNTLALVLAYYILSVGNKRLKILLSIPFGLSIAAGVLTKSIVGLVPVMVLAPVLIWIRKDIVKDIKTYAEVFAVSAITAGLPVLFYYGQLILNVPNAWAQIFGYDIRQRLITEGFHNAAKWWFYLERLFIDSDFTPAWILVLTFISCSFFLALRKDLSSILIFCWAFVPLLIFSALHSRAFHYIAPAFPAFALATGQLFLFTGSRLSKIVLVAVLFGLTFNFSDATKRVYRNHKKLPVEWLAHEIKEVPAVTTILEKDLNLYLEGDTYQRWRQQFYLDIISRNRKVLEDNQKVPDNSLIVMPFETALKLMQDPALRERACGYWPLNKPKSKKQSIPNSAAGVPAAMAVLFTDCSQIKVLPAHFRTFKRSVSQHGIQMLYGVNFNSNALISEVTEPAIAFSVLTDPFAANFPAEIVLIAAHRSTVPKIKASLSINKKTLQEIEITGSDFKKYRIKIPQNEWSANSNLFVLKDSKTDKNVDLLVKNIILTMK